MELLIVDAFTDRPFGGNQAGVALVEDFPPEDWMRALAGELRHSETAFVKHVGEDRFHIRYFTPAAEVDLCGHATIAAFTALRECGRIGPGRYALETRSGALTAAVTSTAVWMDMARPEEVRGFSGEETALLYAAYGLDPADAAPGLEPQVVSTGLCDILLPVRNRETLDRAVQNEEAVTELSRRFGAVGFHLFCPGDAPGITARCRNFAPLYAIPEEAATGTANGALTWYLCRRGLLAPGEENRFLQGERMGRPSEILSRLTLEADGPLVRVGGRAAITLRGRWAGPETALL